MSDANATADPLSLRLRLRTDLTFTPDAERERGGMRLEDGISGTFFQIGGFEYVLLSRLDGINTLGEALELTRQEFPDKEISDQQALRVAHWLIEQGLAQSQHSPTSHTPVSMLAAGNPFFVRVPLFHPERLLASISPLVAWLFSPLAVVLTVVVALAAAARLATHWYSFTSSLDSIFSPSRSVALFLCWLVLKLIHEMGHGIVCRRFGGDVRSAGVVFILLAPVAFIDVTSAWRFRSKWQRIFTACGGMYAELIVATLAAFLWQPGTESVWNHWWANCIVMATATTLLFNANPLMRFDGYYVLADLLEIPNLYGKGTQYLQYLRRRYLFGLPAALPTQSLITGLIIRIYAVASCCWRIVVVIGLLVAAARLFEGAGVVLSLAGIALWFVVPAGKLALYLVCGNGVERPRRARFVLVGGALVAIVGGVLFQVAWPFAVTAPGVVEFSPVTAIRAGSAGFVQEVHASNGATVAAGDLLVTLANDQLSLEAAQIASRIEQSQLKCRALRRQRKMAEFEAEVSQLVALQKQAAEKQQQLHRLEVRAPLSGIFLRRDVDSLPGRYLEEGAEFATIGEASVKELRLTLPQDDARRIAPDRSTNIVCRLAGGRSIRTQLSRIVPRATTRPIHDALVAPNGGPLAVKQAVGDDQSEFELLEPRITAIAELTVEQSRSLKTGQRVFVRVVNDCPSIGDYLTRQLLRSWQAIQDPNASW